MRYCCHYSRLFCARILLSYKDVGVSRPPRTVSALLSIRRPHRENLRRRVETQACSGGACEIVNPHVQILAFTSLCRHSLTVWRDRWVEDARQRWTGFADSLPAAVHPNEPLGRWVGVYQRPIQSNARL